MPGRAGVALLLALALLLTPLGHRCALSHPAAAAGQPPAPHHGPAHSLALDLSSSDKSITLGHHLFGSSGSLTITEGGVAHHVKPGDAVTPAELAALLQVALSGRQSLLLNSSSSADGGSISLNLFSHAHLASLVIPRGVTAVDAASKSGLNVSGSLISDGMLLGVAGGAGALSVHAGLIQVGTGGSITTHVPAALLGSPGAAGGSVNLSLYSLSDIINSGSITASGSLLLSAAGRIVNQSQGAAAGAPPPVIAGALGTSLMAGSGTIVNAGVISSRLGGVDINTISGQALTIINAGGQVLAPLGTVNVRDQTYSGKDLTRVTGGLLAGQAVNFHGGNGSLAVLADEIRGPVNVSAGVANVAVKQGDLDLAGMTVTGDPTIVNTGGDVTLPANADGGHTLRFAGQDLAVMASGSIGGAAGLTMIDLSSSNGRGGSLTLAAGFQFSPGTGGTQVLQQSPGPVSNYSLVGPSGSGGSVNLGSVSVKTSGVAAGADAGNVTIVAHDGSPAASAGAVSIGGIDASAASGAAGAVTIIGQGGSIDLNGPITTGGAHAGAVTIAGGEPRGSGSLSINNGTVSGGAFQYFEDPTHAPVDVLVGGNISNTTAGVGASVSITSSGNLELAASSQLVSSRSILLESLAGGIKADGNNLVAARSSVFVLSDQGAITDLGGNTYRSTDGSLVLAAGGNVSIGPSTSLRANDFLLLLSVNGQVSTSGTAPGTGDTLVSNGTVGVLGSGPVTIAAANLISAGALAPAAPATGVMQSSDVASYGSTLIGSFSSVAVNSSVTSNGGDTLLLALGGNLTLGTGTAFQANGGEVNLFASGQVTGSANQFLARAVGTPESFAGGLVTVESGFSLHPGVLSLFTSLGGDTSELAGVESKILSAARTVSAIFNRNSGFYSPALDASGFVIDTALVGPSVHVTDNGIDLGAFIPLRPGGGTIRLDGSNIDITRGAVIIGATGPSALIDLQGSLFKVESYGLAPRGEFRHLLEEVALALPSLADEVGTQTVALDPTVTPVDQNQGLRGSSLSNAVLAQQAGEQPQSTGKQPAIGGESLAAAGSGSDEGPDDNGAGGRVVVDTGAVGGRSASVRPGGGQMAVAGAGRLLAAEHILSHHLGAPQAVSQHGTTMATASTFHQSSMVLPATMVQQRIEIQPVIQVSRSHSDLTIFTTASQVLTGIQGARSDTIAFGERGTTVSVDGRQLVIHTGRVFADNGNEPLTVTTRGAEVTIAPHSAAKILDEPGRPVSVMAIAGGQAAVIVEPAGSGAGKITLAPGEQVTLSGGPLSFDQDQSAFRYVASFEPAAPGDGSPAEHRQAAGLAPAKTTFSLERFLESEPMLAGRSIRLSGAKREGFDRMISHISQAARAQDPGFRRLVPAAAGPSGAEATEPPRVLAKNGTLFTQDRTGAIELKSGSLFLKSYSPVTVKTSLGEVRTRGRALVSIDCERRRFRVRSCSGPGAVFVLAGGRRLPLAPGREVLIADHRPTRSEALPGDGIGRRQLSAYSLSCKLSLVSGDFSILSLLGSQDYMRCLVEPPSAEHREVRDRLLKTHAAIEYLGQSRGRYFVRPKHTASLPDGPFKRFPSDYPATGEGGGGNVLVWNAS